tara:strand:- start:997 stop:1236 length:240 start_codon:yes stop_codon:yes gene_type:complete
MSITKEQLKEGISNNNTFPDGDLELADLRAAVDELRDEYIDEFDEHMREGTTISADLLSKYTNLMSYESLMLILPILPS